MKAILEFDLPEDQQEFYQATNGGKAFSVLWELDQELRSKIKYAGSTEIETTTFESIRESLHQLMVGQGINFDEILTGAF